LFHRTVVKQFCAKILYKLLMGGRGRVIVGFSTNFTISAYYH